MAVSRRKRRDPRADDQGRLVAEKASGVGPQGRRRAAPVVEAPAEPELPVLDDEPPPKRGPGRPRKHPPRDPNAPKRKPGRPRKSPGLPLPEPGPPAEEPDAVELPPSPRDQAGRPLSLLWDSVRAGYSSRSRRVVEGLLAAGALELDDLVWLELAEHEALGELMTGATERMQERLVSSRQQSRKQIMRIIVERGPVGGVNARTVRVPDGLSLDELTRPPDFGDDILAEPVIEELPERYREAATAMRSGK